MNRLLNFIYARWLRFSFQILVLLYCTVRFFNLEGLPIFNDEAIYLHWGWEETHIPGALFYSLFDAKQPLLMWVYGILENFSPDPLFVGRLTSVITGLLTLIALYKIAILLFNRNVALLTVLLYILVPVFSFYDRQALMESAIATASVWLLYFILLFFQHGLKKHALWIGVIAGIGFFIKSSMLLFVVDYVILVLLVMKYGSKKRGLLTNVSLSFVIMGCVDVLLLIQPMFWQTISSNSRYTLTLSEIVSFPFALWWQNIVGNIEISIVYLTPLVFVFTLVGMYRLLCKKESSGVMLTVYFFLIAFVLQTFTARFPSVRYIVSILPLITIFCSVGVFFVWNCLAGSQFSTMLRACLIIVLVLSVCSSTLLQIIYPLQYFLLLRSSTPYSQFSDYISSWPSGYGNAQAIAYVQNISLRKKIHVFVREDFGNPEDAMFLYLQRKSNISINYLTFSCNELKDMQAEQRQRLSLYFISRGTMLDNDGQCLQMLKKFSKPFGTSVDYVGVYRLE